MLTTATMEMVVRTIAMWVVAAVAAGCAAGHREDKVLRYTDHKLFDVEQHGPARGGHVVGTVCAVGVRLDEHAGRDGLDLVGRVEAGATLPMVLAVRELGGADGRDIVGAIGRGDHQAPGEGAPDPTIHLQLTPTAIRGQVGSRRLELRRRGDDYVGVADVGDARMPYAVRGAGVLWRLPAAAQASILPLLLTCAEPTREIQVVDLTSTQLPAPAPSPPQHMWVPPEMLAPSCPS